jgi:hypothetical protein
MNATNDQATAGTYHLPLSRVALCLDCEACFDITTGRCPACGGRMWALVAGFVARSLGTNPR